MALRAVCVLLLTLFISNAFSETQEPDVNRLVFMTADVWPWGYLGDDSMPKGLISVFAARLAQEANLQLDNQILPHQRLLSKFENGEADYTVVFENPDLDGFADSLGVVLRADILLVTDPAYTGDLTLAALAGKRVGYISGTYYGEAFAQNESVTKIAVYSLDQAIEMLHLGRLHAFISSDIVFHYSLKARKLQPDSFLYTVHTRGHAAHLYISRQASNRHIALRLKAALAHLEQTGELRRLFHSEVRSSAE